jgi:LysM repeat protein
LAKAKPSFIMRNLIFFAVAVSLAAGSCSSSKRGTASNQAGELSPKARIQRINDAKMVYTVAGETLDDLARLYNIDALKLLGFNDNQLKTGDIMPQGTRVFLEEKNKEWKGKEETTLVRGGQTMFDIAQEFGVQYALLLNRNKMAPGEEPDLNEKIWLKGRRSGNAVRIRPTTPIVDAVKEPVVTPPPPTPVPEPPVVTTPTRPEGNPTPPPPQPAPVLTPIPEPTTPPAGNAANSSGVHVVVKGDTMFSLAKRYNITVARLQQLNGMKDANIKIGQRLKVPAN